MRITRRESIAAGTMGALGLLGSMQSSARLAAEEPSATGSTSAKVTLLQINDSHGYLDLHQEWFPGPDGRPTP